MTWQSLLSIIAASIGFVSGIWLCMGAALVTPERIIKASDDSWKADPDIAGTIISQSAEYLAGGMLLVCAFGLQVAVASTPTTIVQSPYPILLSAWFVFLVSIVASWLLSYPIYVLRKTWLTNKTQKIKQKQE